MACNIISKKVWLSDILLQVVADSFVSLPEFFLNFVRLNYANNVEMLSKMEIKYGFSNTVERLAKAKVSSGLQLIAPLLTMMTSPNGNVFRVTGPLGGEFTGHRWITPHKGQWRGALMFTLTYAWINGWVNTREAGDLRCHRAYYDVSVRRWGRNIPEV